MDGEDSAEGQVIVMDRPKSLKDVLGLDAKPAGSHRDAIRPQTAPPPLEPENGPAKKSDPLPQPGDPYQACAGLLNRLATEQKYLHFVDRDGFSVGFSYHDLRRISWADSKKPGMGPVLLLYFVDWVVTEIRIEGRNLQDIRYWIGEGMMPWVRELPNGFSDRDQRAAVISAISIAELERDG